MVYVIQVCWQLAIRIRTETVWFYCWWGAAAEPNQFRPDPARKLSANLYDIYHCCVNSEKLLMMDRGTELCSKNKFEKLVYLAGFII